MTRQRVLHGIQPGQVSSVQDHEAQLDMMLMDVGVLLERAVCSLCSAQGAEERVVCLIEAEASAKNSSGHDNHLPVRHAVRTVELLTSMHRVLELSFVGSIAVQHHKHPFSLMEHVAYCTPVPMLRSMFSLSVCDTAF
jgi:hypothetical protein